MDNFAVTFEGLIGVAARVEPALARLCATDRRATRHWCPTFRTSRRTCPATNQRETPG